MIVLGINAYHGDASAALFRDGQLLAAVEEERFTRVKHAAGFPSHAVRWCLESNGVDAAEIDHVAIARKRSAHLARKALWQLIPAPTHIDGTGRLQTVSRAANPLYHELYSAFDRLTGVPAVLNTSFNESEPMGNTPEQALDCFSRTGMDTLALGPFLVE